MEINLNGTEINDSVIHILYDKNNLIHNSATLLKHDEEGEDATENMY